MDRLSSADLRVLSALESGIPFEERPWRVLSAGAGLAEEDFLERTRALLASGAIRRLAVLFDSRALGFATTLVAAEVRDGRFDEAAGRINSFDEVTHNYRRAGSPFEIWFTLTASGRGRIEEILAALKESSLFESLLELPAERVFKAHVSFSGLTGRGGADD